MGFQKNFANLKPLAVDSKLNGIFLETENIKADIYAVSDKQSKVPS